MLHCLTMEGQGIGRCQQPERKRRRRGVRLAENLWPNRQERQEVSEDCTVIPTAMHVQFTLRRFSYVHISSNDMVCQQITAQSKRKCESCPISCNQSPTYTKV